MHGQKGNEISSPKETLRNSTRCVSAVNELLHLIGRSWKQGREGEIAITGAAQWTQAYWMGLVCFYLTSIMLCSGIGHFIVALHQNPERTSCSQFLVVWQSIGLIKVGAYISVCTCMPLCVRKNNVGKSISSTKSGIIQNYTLHLLTIKGHLKSWRDIRLALIRKCCMPIIDMSLRPKYSRSLDASVAFLLRKSSRPAPFTYRPVVKL